jgi:hypothetical protein
LISHTLLSHEVAITRHVDAFTKYISSNQLAIEAKAEEKLTDDKISYSDRVFIRLLPLIKSTDADTKEIIWKHLLTIYGILYPDSQAKDIIRQMNAAPKSGETEALQNMVSQLVPHLSEVDGSNPMSAIMGLVSSGVFSNLINTMQKGVEDGTLDMSTLLGSATSLLSQPNLINDKMIEDSKGPK